jgi:DNA recombination-dependent growth factor C
VGATSGSISYRLYHVDGDLPDQFKDVFLEQIEEFRFRELTEDAEDEESIGWVELGDLLSADFNRNTVFLNEYLCLSMRMDRWSLPAALFRATYDRRSRKLADERGKKKLSRTEADSLKDELRREFKKQTMPSASMVDMVWNVDTGQLRFWSQAKKRNEYFVELFESTFGMRIYAQSPYIAARQLPLEKDVFSMLADVEQDNFQQAGDR